MAAVLGGLGLVAFAFIVGGVLNKIEFGEAFNNPFKQDDADQE